MSPPRAASGLLWIPLLLIASFLFSSKLGYAGWLRQVCNTAAGNNTHVQCNVSYNSTELLLSCPSDAPENAVNWYRRSDGTALKGSGSSRLVNPNRSLTYDDSGDYVCETAKENGMMYQVVHIDVLAPPKLLSEAIMICHGESRNSCFIDIYSYFSISSPRIINLTISYVGEGPINVQWYHNNNVFHCSSLKGACLGIGNTSTSQTLLFRSHSMEDASAIDGTYRAVVSNHYGANESIFKLQHDCEPGTIVNEYTKEVLSLVEGSKLNTSCAISIHSSTEMFACITKNMSASFDDAVNAGECVRCTGTNQCAEQNLTGITVSRFTVHDCPLKQRLNFISDEVTLEDNGTEIMCAYAAAAGLDPVLFHSIILKVSQRGSSFPVVSVSVSVPASFFLVVVVVLSLLVVAAVLRSRAARNRHQDNRRETIIDESGDCRPQEQQCENEALLPEVDSISQYNQPQCNGYGSIAPDPIGHINMCREYDSPSVVVQIHPD